ncbi:MAG: response regulator transcription factor [Lachnospiraceae bacterium]|nr:response regulator transcription factor [Lachnospiraceae bacterium]
MNILVLEDDIELATGIEISLQEKDLQFTKCQTIQDAKAQLKIKNFDLLILDVNLPDGSGFELCQRVRRTSKVPILLLTARDMEIDVVRGLECGADDYITKPFSTMILRARMRALLRRTSVEQGKSVYQKASFRFEFSKMEFYKDGNLVDLSRTEQRILYILVFNEGQIITRERLLEWVWPDGTEYVEDNALSVGIRRLRDKLEDTPSKPVHIKTVYGKGYIWEN